MSGFLQKQGKLLLKTDQYAYFLAALLAFIPLTDCLSLSVIGLVTLRKGALSGFKVLAAGLATALLAFTLEAALPFSLLSLLLTFVMTWLAAVVLHYTVSWKMTVWFILATALAGVLMIHAFVPEFIMEQFNALLSLFKTLDPDGYMVQALDQPTAATREMLANYLLGVKAFSIIFSVLSSLLLSRLVQSSLYNPGALKQEVLTFRATRTGMLLLIVCAFAVYQGNAVAASCFPLLVIYLSLAGMALWFSLLSKKKNWLIVLLLLVPLLAIPYVVLPAYVLLGSLDTVFNFRSRLSLKADELRGE